MTLSLTDASRLLETLEPEEISTNPELAQFTSDVQDVGIEILKARGRQYLQDISSFVGGTITASLREHGEYDGLKDLLILESNPDVLQSLAIDVLKVCVGLAAFEELR